MYEKITLVKYHIKLNCRFIIYEILQNPPIPNLFHYKLDLFSCLLMDDFVPLAEQELLTLPEHLSSPPVFRGVRVTRSLVLYVC